MSVEFVPESAEVSAPAAVVEWIVSGDGDAPDPQALAAGGVLEHGVLHPRLQAIRDTVAAARVHVLIERGERRGRGWLGPEGAAIAHPVPDGRVRLVRLAGPLLIDALVRLNDLGPRPRAGRAPRIAARPGELAQAIAARNAAALRLEDTEQADAFAALIAGMREHWRVVTRWEPSGGRDLEVLDTDDGYWLVVRDDPTVELWPVTSSAVLAGLCNLFPPTAEVGKWTPA